MAFDRKIHCDLSAIGCVESVKEKKVIAELTKGGSVRNRVVVEDKPIDVLKEEMKVFVPSEYTLENLLAAGVPLDRINTRGLIHSNDKATIEEQLNEVTMSAFDKLYRLDAENAANAAVVENNDSKTE